LGRSFEAIWRHRWLASALGGLAGLLCCLSIQLEAEPLDVFTRLKATLGAPEPELPQTKTVHVFLPKSPSAQLLFEPSGPERPTGTAMMIIESKPGEFRVPIVTSMTGWPLRPAQGVFDPPLFLGVTGVERPTAGMAPVAEIPGITKALTPRSDYSLWLLHAAVMLQPTARPIKVASAETEASEPRIRLTGVWTAPAVPIPEPEPLTGANRDQSTPILIVPLPTTPRVRFGTPAPPY
jgi:hypothetical protein